MNPCSKEYFDDTEFTRKYYEETIKIKDENDEDTHEDAKHYCLENPDVYL